MEDEVNNKNPQQEKNEKVYLEKIEHPALDKFLQQTVSYKDGYYRVQPYGMVFPKSFLKFEQRIRDFKIEDSDVWIATNIKSGTSICDSQGY